MKNLLIVDISGFVYRNHFAFSKRIVNGGSFGALRTILKLVKELNITGIVFAFDSRRDTLKRSKNYKEYKQNRKPTPNSLIEQIKTFQTIAYKMGITCIQMEGYEADDLIWTAIKLLKDQYDQIYVATSDKDLQQVMINDKIMIVHDGKLDKITNRQDYINENGITPEQLPDLFGLIGDTSDNIPGVKGIGYQTALKLIQKYHTIEEIINNIENIEISQHIKDLLEEFKNMAILSKELASLITCEDLTKINADFSDQLWGKVFQEYDFKSLMKYAPNDKKYEKLYLLTSEQLKALGIDESILKDFIDNKEVNN